MCARAHELLGRFVSRDDKEMPMARVNTMLRIAAKLLGKKTEEKETLLLEGDHQKDESQDPNGQAP
jgi:hypothetical protein